MDEPLATLAFIAVLGVTSALAFSARRFHRRDVLPHLEGWALADRRFGTGVTWFLLGGSIFTAYTFAAVPGLAYGTGALGFFPLAYTVILCPVLFVILPRLWTAARRTGAVTVADYVRARYDSPALMLVVALTDAHEARGERRTPRRRRPLRVAPIWPAASRSAHRGPPRQALTLLAATAPTLEQATEVPTEGARDRRPDTGRPANPSCRPIPSDQAQRAWAQRVTTRPATGASDVVDVLRSGAGIEVWVHGGREAGDSMRRCP